MCLQASNLQCTLSEATLCWRQGGCSPTLHRWPSITPKSNRNQWTTAYHNKACISQFGILIVCNLRSTFLCKLFFPLFKVLLSNQADLQWSEGTIHICTTNFTLYHSSHLKYPFSDFSYSSTPSKQLTCLLCRKYLRILTQLSFSKPIYLFLSCYLIIIVSWKGPHGLKTLKSSKVSHQFYCPTL